MCDRNSEEIDPPTTPHRHFTIFIFAITILNRSPPSPPIFCRSGPLCTVSVNWNLHNMRLLPPYRRFLAKSSPTMKYYRIGYELVCDVGLHGRTFMLPPHKDRITTTNKIYSNQSFIFDRRKNQRVMIFHHLIFYKRVSFLFLLTTLLLLLKEIN